MFKSIKNASHQELDLSQMDAMLDSQQKMFLIIPVFNSTNTLHIILAEKISDKKIKVTDPYKPVEGSFYDSFTQYLASDETYTGVCFGVIPKSPRPSAA